MGYSCSTKAGNKLEAMFEKDVTGCKSNNGWIGTKGYYCFYEIGRENSDGAITGSVHRSDAKNEKSAGSGNCRCYKIGSFRIEPDGTITRFPHLTHIMREAEYKILIPFPIEKARA